MCLNAIITLIYLGIAYMLLHITRNRFDLHAYLLTTAHKKCVHMHIDAYSLTSICMLTCAVVSTNTTIKRNIVSLTEVQTQLINMF